MLTKLSLKKLYNSKSHIGYSRDTYFNLIKDFIFATKVDYFILNVVKTLLNLKLAIWFSFYIAIYKNKMLFVYNAPESFMYIFGLIFKVFGHFTFKTKWRSGTLTNFRRIRKHYRYLYVKYIRDYKIYKKLTFFTYYNKKLAPQICDYLFIRRLPSLLIFLSAYVSDIAVKEGFIVRIPSIGLNSNRSVPSGLTFPVISNDVSEETFNYYLLLFKNILYKSLFYRRLEFFELLNNKNYLYSKVRKTWKSRIFSVLMPSLNKSNFFNINASKYKLTLLKYSKHFNKKLSFMLFLRYKRKRFFKYKKFFFIFRKERKKRSFYIRSIFANINKNFFLNKVRTNTFLHSRKIFFINVFFTSFLKKKVRLLVKTISLIIEDKEKIKNELKKKIKKKKKKIILKKSFFFCIISKKN